MRNVFVAINFLGLLLIGGWMGYSYIQKDSVVLDRPMSQVLGLETIPQFVVQKTDDCGALCAQKIATLSAELDILKQRVTALESATRSARIAQPTSKPLAKRRSTQYVTIPGSGTTGANDWVNLNGTDFYFDTADYPGLVDVYFEATVALKNGNGEAYVRLFDTTHGIGVQGSDISTKSQGSVVTVSGRVSFWAGRNLIRVQAKSLTADTAIYESGRLRILTEQ